MTPWTVAHQASLCMGFSSQEYWRGLPFLSPGDLPNSGIKPGSPTLTIWGIIFYCGKIYITYGEGNGTPLQYFCLEGPMDGGAWWAAVHGVDRIGHDWATSLSLFTFMHWRRKWQPTRVLAWRIPGTGSLVGCCLWGRTESDTTEAT